MEQGQYERRYLQIVRETIEKVIFARCKRNNRKVRKVILRCLDDWFLQQLTSGCVRGAFLQKDKIVDDKMTMFPILVSSTAAGLLVTGLSVPEDNSQLFPVKVFFRQTHHYIKGQLTFAYFNGSGGSAVPSGAFRPSGQTRRRLCASMHC